MHRDLDGAVFNRRQRDDGKKASGAGWHRSALGLAHTVKPISKTWALILETMKDFSRDLPQEIVPEADKVLKCFLSRLM